MVTEPTPKCTCCSFVNCPVLEPLCTFRMHAAWSQASTGAPLEGLTTETLACDKTSAELSLSWLWPRGGFLHSRRTHSQDYLHPFTPPPDGTSARSPQRWLAEVEAPFAALSLKAREKDSFPPLPRRGTNSTGLLSIQREGTTACSATRSSAATRLLLERTFITSEGRRWEGWTAVRRHRSRFTMWKSLPTI